MVAVVNVATTDLCDFKFAANFLLDDFRVRVSHLHDINVAHERQSVTILLFQLPNIHVGFSLKGLKAINPSLNQVRDEQANIAVSVVDDRHAFAVELIAKHSVKGHDEVSVKFGRKEWSVAVTHVVEEESDIKGVACIFNDKFSHSEH